MSILNSDELWTLALMYCKGPYKNQIYTTKEEGELALRETIDDKWPGGWQLMTLTEYYIFCNENNYGKI